MQPLLADRRLLRQRIRAALDTLVAMEEVDNTRIAVMGFCFGGLCALDLARSGADIVGAASFHGILKKPDDLGIHPIQAKVLVMHGYDDPMVRPADIEAFCAEMTTADVDWQVHMYGHTQHAFTNPQAHDVEHGLMYDAMATRRSMQLLVDFLEEIFS